MLVQAKILSADIVDHLKKDTGELQKKCEVALQLSQPTEIFICTIWQPSLNKGEHHLYLQLVGKNATVALRFECFKNKIAASLNTSVLPVEIGLPAKKV